jgi:hypothetical protein
MGAEIATEPEKLTARDLQILDHLEQAQNLEAPLTEYGAAYTLDVKDLYAGKAQLVQKGSLPGQPDQLPLRICWPAADRTCTAVRPQRGHPRI